MFWFKREEDFNEEELKLPQELDEYYFDIEHYNVYSVRYIKSRHTMEICFFDTKVNLITIFAECSYGTYLEHLERFKTKIQNQLGE